MRKGIFYLYSCLKTVYFFPEISLRDSYFIAGIIILFLLSASFPDGIPFFIFLGIILFTFSEKGKNLFDITKWEDDTENLGNPENSLPQKNSQISKNSSEKKSEKNTSFFNFQNTMAHNNNTPNGFSPAMIFAGVLGFLILSIVSDGVVSIPAGSTGVVFDKLSGGIKEETLPSGISLKVPFIQQVTIINTRLQEETINSKRNPITALTKDGQKVNVEVTVQYIINTTDASKLYEEIGMDYKSKVVTAGIRSIVREVITGFDSTELFNNESRKKAQEQMRAQLEKNYKENYIELKDVLIRDVKFSDKYLDAIEEKKVAEQQIQKAEFERKEAEVRNEITVLNAKAEAESMKVKGEALKSSPELIQLKFVEKMAPNINWGILPDGAVPMINTADLQKK